MDDLYWETGISGRIPYRRFFRGWERAYANCRWFVQNQPRRDVHVGVYGCKALRKDGLEAGFRRSLLPDYRTAVVDKIFLDVDCHDEAKEAEFHADINLLEEYLDAEEIRRRWVFTGGGIYYLIAANGKPENVDNAVFHFLTKIIKHQMVDPVAFDVARTRRFPGSYHAKRGCWVIPIDSSELSLSLHDLRLLAQSPRAGIGKGAGRYELEIDMLERCTTRSSVTLGKYERSIVPEEKEKVLEEYGIDWEHDFCDAMKSIITRENVSNFERIQLLKYLNAVVKVPFVDVVDKNKTVMNLVYNLLDDKKKAAHSVAMAEAENVYKRDRTFHPYKLRALGYCPEGCSTCLDRRQE